MTEQFTNFAITSLAIGIGTSDTTLTVSSITHFPTSPTFRITLSPLNSFGLPTDPDPEIMLVTNITGKVFTITRGIEGSTIKTHAAGDNISHALTAAVIQSLAGNAGIPLTLTDGSNTVANVGQITVSGGTVGGASPNATLTLTGSSVLGTSSGATNPQRSGQAGTGFFTAGSNLVDVACNGNQIAEFGTQGIGVGTSAPTSLGTNGLFNLGNTGNLRYLSGGGSPSGFVVCAFGNYINSSNAYYDGNFRYEMSQGCALVQTAANFSNPYVALQMAPGGAAGAIATFTEYFRCSATGVAIGKSGTAATSALDVVGTVKVSADIQPNISQSMLSGTTAGSLVYAMPFQGTAFKKFVGYFSGYENNTATNQTVTFPIAFTNPPVVTANNSGLTVSITATVLTITAPNNTTLFNGNIIIEGF